MCWLWSGLPSSDVFLLSPIWRTLDPHLAPRRVIITHTYTHIKHTHIQKYFGHIKWVFLPSLKHNSLTETHIYYASRCASICNMYLRQVPFGNTTSSTRLGFTASAQFRFYAVNHQACKSFFHTGSLVRKSSCYWHSSVCRMQNAEVVVAIVFFKS